MESTIRDAVLLILNASSAIGAFAAGYYWLRSAQVKTPSKIRATAIPISGMMGGPRGAMHVQSGDLNDLATALTEQSKRGAAGAKCASIAAILQGAAIALPLVWRVSTG